MQGFGLQSVSIRGMAESNSDMASERIQSDFKQFTRTVSSIFKTSQEIRVPKAYRMGSTYFDKAREQRSRPLKIILESAEHAKVFIDTTGIRVNSGNPIFSKGTIIQGKTEDERASNRAFTACREMV